METAVLCEALLQTSTIFTHQVSNDFVFLICGRNRNMDFKFLNQKEFLVIKVSDHLNLNTSQYLHLHEQKVVRLNIGMDNLAGM